jgi:crossover junction endodeoxyribonuclease RuvC
MIIIGVDPGVATIGYAIIKTKNPKHKHFNREEKPKVIDFGCIITEPNSSAGERLKKIYNELNKLIKKHKPNIISVENLYFFKNLKTAMPVSQAKGVILFTAAKHKIPVYEFTPLQVKMTITGYGKAEKRQVQKMTKELLNLSGFDLKEKNRKKDDATDALGVAICAALKRFT